MAAAAIAAAAAAAAPAAAAAAAAVSTSASWRAGMPWVLDPVQQQQHQQPICLQ
jgi:hypothetical protein